MRYEGPSLVLLVPRGRLNQADKKSPSAAAKARQTTLRESWRTGLVQIGVVKSPYHHLSQIEIASDNPCGC